MHQAGTRPRHPRQGRVRGAPLGLPWRSLPANGPPEPVAAGPAAGGRAGTCAQHLMSIIARQLEKIL